MRGALGLILSVAGRPASDAQVVDFARFALQRGIDTTAAWVAEIEGRLCWAALPVMNPGRTMLLFGPSEYLTLNQKRAATELTGQVLGHYAGRGVHLVQVLLDPADDVMVELYRGMGFEKMADLLYLQGSPRSSAVPPPALPGVTFVNYSAETHGLFAEAIAESYRQSLDCPKLAGLRDIEDVVAGHKGTGQFDSKLWRVALDQTSGQPLGVLLLNPTGDHEAMELVYVGVAPAARGRGLGDCLVRQALAAAARDGCQRLTLAVDAANTPALRLYYRHGMKRLTSKVAMIRDVRRSADVRAPNAE